MGKIWGNMAYIKNIAYHRVSPYELNPFASKLIQINRLNSLINVSILLNQISYHKISGANHSMVLNVISQRMVGS